MISLESIILAAGFCSRFNFHDKSFKKFMLPLERSNILNYIITAMSNAGVDKVNIIIDEKVETSNIFDAFYNFSEKYSIKSPILNFIENKYSERENGFSLFLGVKEINSQFFILSMADHVFSDNVYKIIAENYREEDIILATDPMKIIGIYDLKDCTKVFGTKSKINKIGKIISDYNRLDMGVFIMKTKTIKELSEIIEKQKEKFGVSDIILKAIDMNYNVKYLDFPTTIWLDIDTDLEYKKLHKTFYKKSKIRPFNLDLNIL